MSDVLINFVIRDQSIDEAASKLDQLTDAERKVGDQAKKTYSDMDNAQKRIASSIDGMAKASKTLDKSIVAGAYKKYLATIQKELGLTQKELIAYIKNARKASQEAIITTEDEAKVKELEVSLSVLNETLEEFSKKEEETSQKTKTFRQEIKEAELALKEMYEAGKAGTPEFDELQQKIGDLKDEYGDFQNTFKTLGSDTRTLDGLISLTSGLAGGFAVAQGAAALLGDENEDLQKVLTKVAAAMAILQGLQEIQSVLQKDSAAMILLNTVRTKAQTVATNIQTAATGAGTIAQRAYNVALAASPIGWVILALTAAIGIMSAFSDETKEATEAIKELDEATNDYYSTVAAFDVENKRANERRNQIRDNEELIKQYEAMGGHERDIYKLKKDNISAELIGLYAARERVAGNRGALIDEKEKLKVTKEINDLDDEIYRKRNEYRLNELDFQKKQEAAAKEAADKAKKAAQEALEANKEALSERKALIDKELSELKIAGKEEELVYLQKQKAAIDAQAAITAIEIKGINQRAAVFAKAEEDKDALQKAYEEKQTARQYEIDKKEIDARLAVVKQGSEDELAIKREALERDAANEKVAASNTIKNEKDLASVRVSIDKKLKADLKKLDDDFLKQRLQSGSELDLLNDQSRIISKQRELIGLKDKAQIAKIDQEIYKIKLAGVLKEAALNEDLYSKGLITEEEYLKAKASLNSKYLTEENSAFQAAYDERERLLQGFYQRINQSLESTFSVLGNSIDATIVNSEGIRNSLQGAWSAYAEFVKIQQSDATQAEKFRAKAVTAIAASQQAINGIFADGARQRMQELDAQIDKLNELRDIELDNANLTEEQKLQINEKYRKKEAQVKLAAWKADKDARRKQAIINTALAIINTLATAPWPANIALAAAAGITGGIQVATIANEQPPKFKKGKIRIQGPGTETSDSIPALISKNESVINAQSSKKWEDALEAINSNTFEGWLANRFSDFAIPEVPSAVYKAFEDRGPSGIDYQKLAEAMAKNLPEAPEPTYIQNNFDEGGFHRWVVKGNSRTQYHNKRYSMS